jgi:SAM-dependent methyltransferase
MLKKKIRDYKKTFKKYGVDPRALRWTSKSAAEIHYKQLVADVNFEGKEVLDVGCGFGDIIAFIKKKTTNFSYTGVDVVEEFISVARKRYPNSDFVLRDYFGNPMDKSFDIVISSGALNANIGDPISYRKKAISTMFDHTREVLAFNMAGGYPQPKNKKGYRVYYADSLEILKFCLSKTSKIIFRQHYRKKDFTIVMFK